MTTRLLSKIQWGLESTRGTAVAADTMWAAKHPPISVDRKPKFERFDLGLRAENTHAHIDQYLYEDTLSFQPAYFQALPALFSIGIKGSITPVEQTGSQSDYLWAFTPSWTAANSPQSLTMELGDDTQAYEVEYVMAKRYRISGAVSQDQGESPVNIDMEYFGRQLTATTFTGSLSAPTISIMNAKHARYYRDTSWAGIGGTEKTSVLRGFDLDIITGVHPKFFGSANKYFSTHGEGYIGFMATFTWERSAESDAVWDLQQAGTKSFVELEVIGDQIGTGVNHKLEVKMAGTWQDVVPLSSEDNGNNIDVGVLVGTYDFTGAEMLDINVYTNVSAI